MSEFILRLVLRAFLAGMLLAGSVSAHAAPSDCIGLAPDGQVACILPSYKPITYTACDIAGTFLYRDNAWNACYAEMGLSNPLSSEGAAVSVASCFDKKIMTIFGQPGAGGVSGPVPWLPVGTYYNDNLCTGGTVREVNGHHIYGVGTKAGSSSNFAFIRREEPFCPASHTGVSGLVNGINELVACKPICPNGTEYVNGICKPVFDVYRVHRPPKADMCAGNPVYPMTGSKKEEVPTGFMVGGVELVLTYDSINRPGNRPGPRMWNTNLHKSLGISAGTLANRGCRPVRQHCRPGWQQPMWNVHLRRHGQCCWGRLPVQR
jgi:hypothetical protein